MNKALLVIDLQNDYFDGGKFPLWNTDTTLNQIEKAIQQANKTNIPVILIQHVADSTQGIAPFFNEKTEGVNIHQRILDAAPHATVVQKSFADSFHHTNLEAVLSERGITDLLICGMMTQNCVTHTAISKAAEKYNVMILPDCCTTINEPIHLIALHAVSTRVPFLNSGEALS